MQTMNRKAFIFILVALIFASVSASIFLFRMPEKPDSIRTTGVVEGTEANISSTVSGRILKICCKEGDMVAEGAVVIELENDDIKASVEQASAGVEKAEADLQSTQIQGVLSCFHELQIC